MEKIAFVIPVFNRLEYNKECLQLLEKQKITSFFRKNEIIDQKSGYTFEIETKSTVNIEEIKSDIQKSILSLPWSSVNKLPVISLFDQATEKYIFKITVFAIDKSFVAKIEDHIKKQYPAL
jgi:hypothetical protein